LCTGEGADTKLNSRCLKMAEMLKTKFCFEYKSQEEDDEDGPVVVDCNENFITFD